VDSTGDEGILKSLIIKKGTKKSHAFLRGF